LISKEECKEILRLIRYTKWHQLAEYQAIHKLVPLVSERLPGKEWESLSREARGKAIWELFVDTIEKDLRPDNIHVKTPASQIYNFLKLFYLNKETQENTMDLLKMKSADSYKHLRDRSFDALSLVWYRKLCEKQTTEEGWALEPKLPPSSPEKEMPAPKPYICHGYPALWGYDETVDTIKELLKDPQGPKMVGLFCSLPGPAMTEVAADVADELFEEDAIQAVLWTSKSVLFPARGNYSYEKESTSQLGSRMMNSFASQITCSGSEIEAKLRSGRYLVVFQDVEAIPDAMQTMRLLLTKLGQSKAILTSRRYLLDCPIPFVEWLEAFIGPTEEVHVAEFRKEWGMLSKEARNILVYTGITAVAPITRNEIEQANIVVPSELARYIEELEGWTLLQLREHSRQRGLYDMHPYVRACILSELTDQWREEWNQYPKQASIARLADLRKRTLNTDFAGYPDEHGKTNNLKSMADSVANEDWLTTIGYWECLSGYLEVVGPMDKAIDCERLVSRACRALWRNELSEQESDRVGLVYAMSLTRRAYYSACEVFSLIYGLRLGGKELTDIKPMLDPLLHECNEKLEVAVRFFEDRQMWWHMAWALYHSLFVALVGDDSKASDKMYRRVMALAKEIEQQTESFPYQDGPMLSYAMRWQAEELHLWYPNTKEKAVAALRIDARRLRWEWAADGNAEKFGSSATARGIAREVMRLAQLLIEDNDAVHASLAVNEAQFYFMTAKDKIGEASTRRILGEPEDLGKGELTIKDVTSKVTAWPGATPAAVRDALIKMIYSSIKAKRLTRRKQS